LSGLQFSVHLRQQDDNQVRDVLVVKDGNQSHSDKALERMKIPA
jgi:hypothetical protein